LEQRESGSWWRGLIGPEGLIIAAACAFIGANAGLWPVRNFDYWWHVAMGRLGATTGTIPDQILFVYSVDPLAPSFVQAWLSQRIFWWMQHVSGDSVVPVLTLRNLALTAAAAIGGLVAWRRGAPALLVATMLIGASSLISAYVDARSHLMAWPLIFPVLAACYGARAGVVSMRWPLVVLPVITALWSNLHGSFLVPSMVAFAFGVASLLDKWRRPDQFHARLPALWGATIALNVLSVLTQPLGAKNYEYMVYMVSSPALRQISTEWYPTTPWFPVGNGAMFYLVLVALGVLAWRRRREVDLVDLFLLAGFALLSIRQCRELMWFGLVLPIAAAPLLRDLIPKREAVEPAHASRWLALIGCVSALPLLTQPYNPLYRRLMPPLAVEFPQRDREPHLGVFLRNTPVEGADKLVELLDAGSLERGTMRLFAPHDYSGYLLHRLQQPGSSWPMVFTDHRYEIITAEQWDIYDRISAAEPGWREELARYEVDVVIASSSEQAPLQARLGESAEWSELVTEADYTLFVRSSALKR
jgi:hypothetical protein